MNIATRLEDVQGPCAVTIGMFDGVHLGHQQLLCKLSSYGLPAVVLTFPEHPLQVLGGNPPRLITPIQVKLALLETIGIHTTVVIPFTKQLASMPFDELLSALPVKQLVFGKGAAFGKKRAGDETAVRAWAKTRSVAVEYVEKTPVGSGPVSSSRIREAIEQGKLALVESLLGHPHMIYVPGNTQRWDASDLALPPDGTYLLAPGLTASISRDSISVSKPHPKPAIYPLSRNPS